MPSIPNNTIYLKNQSPILVEGELKYGLKADPRHEYIKANGSQVGQILAKVDLAGIEKQTGYTLLEEEGVKVYIPTFRDDDWCLQGLNKTPEETKEILCSREKKLIRAYIQPALLYRMPQGWVVRWRLMSEFPAIKLDSETDVPQVEDF